MKKLNLKSNAFNKGEVLTRAQLKKVLGGDGSEDFGSGSADISKIKACETFAMGDCCTFITNGTEYPGKCSSYMASEKYCSTFSRC